MTEAWAWGKEFQLGYAKHPPFTAWLVGGWFAVMPRTDWSFYLLAALNAGVGLAGVWMLAGVFFGTAGRLASVLFQVLTPSFSLGPSNSTSMLRWSAHGRGPPISFSSRCRRAASASA
jgi:4-amino-4-deoxy-L-arabinose transferase-like glycosyltransferase